MGTKCVYEFTDGERKVIEAAQQKLTMTIQVIAEIHGLQGQISLDQELKGFLGPDPEGKE